MKKTLLLFGLLAGLGAQAQNKDLQDIEKLIKDKQAKDKESIQNYKPLTQVYQYPGQLKYSEPYVLPNGDRLVYGTLDNMPIVQPDMRNFYSMPNPKVDMNDFRTMPNAAKKLFFSDGPNSIMDQLAPSPVLENLLKKNGK